MNVGLITYDFYPPIGGQGVEAFGLYKALRKKAEQGVVVVSAAKNDLEDHVSLSPGAPSVGQFIFSARLARMLDGIVREHCIDVVQAYGGPGGVMLIRRPPVPLVYVANHTYAQQYRFLGKAIYKALMRLEAKGYHLADRIVAISSTTARSLVDDYGVAREKVSVIHIGIDTGLFRPFGVERIPGSVLYVGRLCERKGIPLLVEAMGALAREVPHSKLYVIGEGPLRHRLGGIALDLGIADRVVFLGRVSDEELVKWYNRAQVFVLPSLFEGFGIVCIEAMACGTPVVATRGPGVLDIIDDGRNGILVERDRDKLAKGIGRILQDPERAHGLGEQGRRDALERFDLGRVADRFMKVYEEVAGLNR